MMKFDSFVKTILFILFTLHTANSLPHQTSETRHLEEIGILQNLQDSFERNDTLNKVFQTLSFGIMILTNFLKPTDLSPMFAISLAKLSQSVKCLNISLPYLVSERLNLAPNPVSFSFAFNMPAQLKENFSESSSSGETTLKPLSSSSFFVNQWNLIVTLGAIFVVRLIICVVETATRKAFKKKFSIIMKRLKVMTSWSVVFIVFLSNYDYITFFALLEFQTVAFESFLEIASFVLCLLITFISLYVFFKLLFVGNGLMKTKEEKESLDQAIFKQSYDPFRIIFMEYSNTTQGYLLFYLLRMILCSGILVFFPEYPLIQTLWFIIINITMIYYIIVYRPINRKFSMIITAGLEIAILIVNLFCLSLVFCNTFSISECPAREEIGFSILALKTAMDVCSHVLVYVYFCLTAKSVRYKAKRLAVDGKLTMKNIWQVLADSSIFDSKDKEHVNSPSLASLGCRKLSSKSAKKVRKDTFHPKIMTRYSETGSNLLSTENQATTCPNELLPQAPSKVSLDIDTDTDNTSFISLHLNRQSQPRLSIRSSNAKSIIEDGPQPRDNKFQRKMFFGQKLVHQRNPTIVEEPSQFEDNKAPTLNHKSPRKLNFVPSQTNKENDQPNYVTNQTSREESRTIIKIKQRQRICRENFKIELSSSFTGNDPSLSNVSLSRCIVGGETPKSELNEIKLLP